MAVGVGVLEDNTPGAALLYDVSTGKLRATLPGHKGAVACLAYTPDGKTLASADSARHSQVVGRGHGQRTGKYPNSRRHFRVIFPPVSSICSATITFPL